MKKIYFVRHGESEGNVSRSHQSIQTPLSEVGCSQAKILAHRFKSIQIEAIISSPYQRAMQTAQEIVATKHINLEVNQLFGEKQGPTQLIGLSHHSQQSIDFRSASKKHFLDNDGRWQLSDEETALAFVNRAKHALNWLENREEDSLIVITHSLLLHMIIANILLPASDLTTKYAIYENFIIHNTGITLTEYDHDTQDWRLVCLNDHAHLG